MENEMKFKEGDRVVVVKGSEDHGIPVGTGCSVEEAWEGAEYPYDLRNVLSGKLYGDSVTEDEIELVEV